MKTRRNNRKKNKIKIKKHKTLYKRYTKYIKKGGSNMYTAIIIEPRKHKAIEFVLNNILENLDSQWNCIVFHGNLNKEYIENIINNKLEKYKNRITLLSLNVDNLTISDYNNLLTNKQFYDNIPTEMFLIFQVDSMIIKENKDRINDFLDYDYVGAPWISDNNVGNGGFSLRRKSKMYEIFDKCDYINTNEDYYFSHLIWGPDKANCKNVIVNKPSFEKAQEFSSETIWNPKSFGLHAVWKSCDVNEIKKTIPEIQTLIDLQTIET
jgi:hypothetical protein